VNESSAGIRLRRDLVAGLGVVAMSVLLLIVPVVVYATAMVIRERGAPDQAAIDAFAAAMSPVVMPWLVRLLTLLAAFRVVRRSESPRVVDGIAVGAVAGLLGLAVMLAFGGPLTLRAVALALLVVGIGWVGGIGGRMLPRPERGPRARA